MRFDALVAVALLLSSPAAARADCDIEGVASIDRLRVRVPGEPLRTMSITDLPVSVRPGRSGLYRDVHVLAPLAFAARTDAPIPWTVPRPSAVAGGMLWLTPRAEVEQVRDDPDGEGVVARVQVDAGVWIGRVHLPCEALTVGHGEGDSEAPAWATAAGPRWTVRRDRLWLHAELDGGPTVRLDAPDGLREGFTVLERRGAWARVATSFPSGAALRGWVRQRELNRRAGTATPRASFARRLPEPRSGRCRRRPPRSGEYVGLARVSMGAIVHARPDGEAWAAISEPAVVTISWRPGRDWARIVHVPGLAGDGPCPDVLRRAWVPRRAVSLQGEVGRGAE